MDLFSGLGGFALAARAHGVQTITFCEADARCTRFLERAWAGVPVWPDVRTFPGEQFRGVWLLTAGVPCQPASRAGKQRGAADDRWLWPAFLAALESVQPTWALCENPPGIGDVGLAGILAAMESHGYEVQVLSVPAAAVGAPHRRERLWILAHAGDMADADRTGWQGQPGDESGAPQGWAQPSGSGPSRAIGDMADAGSIRTQTWWAAESDGGERTGPCGSFGRLHTTDAWEHAVWVPCADGKFRRAPCCPECMADGVQPCVSEPLGHAHRSILAALGNSIVPAVASEIIGAMIQAEE